MREFLERQAVLFGFHCGMECIPDVEARYSEGGDGYPASVLTGEEHGQFCRFRGWKRKVEWLAGRVAAKEAFSRYAASSGKADPAGSVSVLNDEGRVPYVLNHPEVHLSITHSHGYAVAVVATFGIGIDLEKIEPRPPALTRYFFSERERELLSQGGRDSSARDEIITRIWSRKEALSKFLRRGASLDFKGLEVLDDEPELTLSRERVRLLSAERDGYSVSLAMSLSPLAA